MSALGLNGQVGPGPLWLLRVDLEHLHHVVVCLTKEPNSLVKRTWLEAGFSNMVIIKAISHPRLVTVTIVLALEKSFQQDVAHT